MTDRKPIAELLAGAKHWLAALGRSAAPDEAGRILPAEDPSLIYAVGDIHGRLDLLTALEARIRADIQAQRKPALLIYLGDYIDRGSESRGVIEHLSRRPKLCGREIFLRGNHEQVLLDFLSGADILEAWCQFGGLETLASYGLYPALPLTPDQRKSLRQSLRAALPPHHRQFLSKTRRCFESGRYFFAHAGVNPDVSLRQQSAADLLWIREPFLNSTSQFEKRVVHGHSPAAWPEILPNRINVDTGAYYTGQLSCAVLEGPSCRILSASLAFA